MGFRWVKGLWDPLFSVSKIPEEKGVMPGPVELIHLGASRRLPATSPGPPIRVPGGKGRNGAVTCHSPIFWYVSPQASRTTFCSVEKIKETGNGGRA